MQDNEYAIVLKNVKKSYRLYTSPLLMAVDLLKLPIFRRRIKACPVFDALKGVDLEVRRGERIGVIGRNGAGKTTLLKLITKNFLPSSGTVQVNGQIQGLMDAGLGFHPEFTGRENIRSSLIYNGLSEVASLAAEKEIIEFVELGDFIDQPIKTYSLGMATRLAFATATAIKPEVLIIDEVLSAGDGYFAAKSAERVKRMTSGGTTLLLVSHSTDQILQYCDKAIWVDQGRIAMRGDAMEVVKAYDAYLRELENARLGERNQNVTKKIEERRLPSETSSAQEKVAHVDAGRSISRWHGEGGLKICSVQVRDSQGRNRFVFKSGQPVTFEMEIEAERADRFHCKYHFNIFSVDGRNVTSHMSAMDQFAMQKGERRVVRLAYDSILLGQGNYVMTAGLFKNMDQTDHSTAERYDLLDRSFEFKVASKYGLNQSLVYHPSSWILPSGNGLADVSSEILDEGHVNPAY